MKVLQPPKKIGNLYTCTHVLGKGAFGVVYKAHETEDPHKIEYAIKAQDRKVIDSHPRNEKLFNREVQIMGRLSHPNILKLVRLVSTNQTHYMVLKFCRDGDMESLMKRHGRFSEKEAVYF